MKKIIDKKVVIFLLFLIVGNIVKVTANEVIGTILFPPTRKGVSLISDIYEYIIDSTGNSMMDRRMYASKSRGVTDPVFDILTEYYLKQGCKFIFEDDKLGKFSDFGIERILAIEINEKMIELTEMFPLDVIKTYLPHLWAKLIREGRAR